MLVIISDLHLTDGTSGTTISSGAFEIFAERLHDLAASASWRADGRYRPIERIDLVLLGDVLDVIRSSHWLARRDVRPWTNPHRLEFIELVTSITNDILKHNDRSFAVLRELASDGGLRIPAALSGGRPARDGAEQAVPVRIWYMVGNHDWFFHLRGPEYDLLRQSIIRSLGLSNRADHPFPHDPAECDELLDVQRRHKVFARHGDLYDPFNFEGERDASSLGDAIVIELINRFAASVEEQMADELPATTLLGLREIDNVRPVVTVPVWIDGLLERTVAYPTQKIAVKRIWDRMADEFLGLNYVRQRDTWNPNDLVDGLQAVLKFSKRLSFGWAASISSWFHQLRGDDNSSFARHALLEQDFRNRRAKHVVYGHTHSAEGVPLDASYADTYVLNQMYFNSGTWRRVFQPTRFDATEHEFIASDVMTYLAFFQADERAGRSFETWSGMLGIPPHETSLLRLDTTRESHGARQTVSPPALHGHRPHFLTPPAGAPVVPARRK
ncbi:MAG: hypothetical protein KF708_21425 [Pirellulales bacterium]|nr:hypothetical protein [Pirellulales bacterium]